MKNNFDNRTALFTMFATLLAIGTLLHQGILGELHLFSHHTALSLTAFWVLLRPQSLTRFLTMSVMQVCCCVIDMPFVVNHWLLLAVMNVAIFLCLVNKILWPVGRREVSSASMYEHFAPVLRVLLLLTYSFAMLAKLNGGFIDFHQSSAVALYMRLAEKVAFLPTSVWTGVPAIWMAILIEFTLPMLLLIRRTRVFGVLLGISFHLLMALAGFTPFSGLAMPMLFLFVPDDFPRRLRTLSERIVPQVMIEQLIPWLSYVIATIMILWVTSLSAVTYGWIEAADLRSVIYSNFPRIYYLYAIGLGVLYVGCIWQFKDSCRHRPTFQFGSPIYWATPVLLVLNALCPYLGLKTESSFTMYSNLQTEGDQWNHLLLPSALCVFSYQDELVRIIDSTHLTLSESAEQERQWVPFEFRRFLMKNPGTKVTYEYRGRVYHSESTDGPVGFLGEHLVWKKCFGFAKSPQPIRTAFAIKSYLGNSR